jgi:DNA-binding MarR family transcriptional regulator
MSYTDRVKRVTKRSSDKTALAREVQGLLIGFLFGRRDLHLKLLQELGLTPGHMKALFELDAEVAVPMGALADTLVCDASSATWMVDRLEERGLVERRPHPKDRRVKTVVLTPAGVRLKAQLIGRLHDPVPELEALDVDALEQLRDALRRLPQQPPLGASIAERQRVCAESDRPLGATG